MMQQSSMELFRRSSHIAGGNATYVEDLYESYLRDPNGVPEQWRDYFDKLPRVESKTSLIEDVPHSALRERFARISKMRVRTEATVAHDAQATQHERKQVRVLALISAYRQRGHQKANLDPLGLAEREHVADLELGFHELSIADLDTPFQVGSLHIGRDVTPRCKEIIDALENAPTVTRSVPSSCTSSTRSSGSGSCSAWSPCVRHRTTVRISAARCCAA
jgi:2-oxoglutarate dehydrogenase E1 component